MKLKIFTELDQVSKNIPCEFILSAFSGKYHSKTDYCSNSIVHNYIQQGNLFFQESSLAEADLVVLPINWEKALTVGIEDRLIAMTQRAKEANKISIGFFGGDCSHLKLKKENDLMFRHSLYASTRSANDFSKYNIRSCSTKKGKR